MARTRNIKPGFFKNEALADLPLEARLMFIGLWCLCDREGKMEFRPRRIKAELFPYENHDCTELAQCLHRAGFVSLYQVDGTDYLAVTNFLRHQHPNVKEEAAGIPDPRPETILAPNQHQTDTVPVRPSTSYPLPHTETPTAREARDADFDKFWEVYPHKVGKPPALTAWHRKKPNLDEVLAGLSRWKRSNAWTKDAGQFIPHPATFLNQERWKDAPPSIEAPLQKGEIRVRESSPREAQEAKLNGFYMKYLKDGKPEKEAARLAQEEFEKETKESEEHA